MTPFWLYVIWVGFSFLFCFWSISVCWCWQYTHQGGDYKHKVDMCLCVSSLWWVIVGDDRLLLSLETNHGVSLCVQHVSWLCWCVGVEHRDGRWTWRRSSRDVPCRWTKSSEGRTWGLDRVTKMAGRVTMVADINKQENMKRSRPCWPSQDGGWPSQAGVLEYLVIGLSRTTLTHVERTEEA